MAKKAMKNQLVAAVSESLYKEVDELAEKQNRSKGAIIRTAVTEYLRRKNNLEKSNKSKEC